MRRREFVTFAGSAALCAPALARALAQRPGLSVIGYMTSRSPESDIAMMAAFRRGLGDAGFVEGRNVAIEYRFADGDYDKLPDFLDSFVRRGVDVIVFAGVPTARPNLIAQMRALPMPLVFNTGSDPVASGLVASLNRPGGNM